jgi:hypothetical protein
MAAQRAARDAHGRLHYEPATGDVVRLRKAHPCGADRMVVTRVALDVRLACAGCGAHLVLTRARLGTRVADVPGTISDFPELGAPPGEA